jgi:hypothetical protein
MDFRGELDKALIGPVLKNVNMRCVLKGIGKGFFPWQGTHKLSQPVRCRTGATEPASLVSFISSDPSCGTLGHPLHSRDRIGPREGGGRLPKHRGAAIGICGPRAASVPKPEEISINGALALEVTTAIMALASGGNIIPREPGHVVQPLATLLER